MADDDLMRLLDEMRQENAAAHDETRRRFDATADRMAADTRHQFELTAEAIKHEVQLTAESVIQVTRELRRETADIREDMRRGFADTQAMIKFSHAELDMGGEGKNQLSGWSTPARSANLFRCCEQRSRI